MTTPSAGAMRAAIYINGRHRLGLSEFGLESLAERIDEQTNHAALVEAAKVIVQDPIRSEYDPSCVVIHESDIDRLRDAIAKAGA